MNRRKILSISRLLALLLFATITAACGEPNSSTTTDTGLAESATDDLAVSDAELEGNPFRTTWQTPFGVPPFAEIETADYLPAVKKALQELRADIDAIHALCEEGLFEFESKARIRFKSL